MDEMTLEQGIEKLFGAEFKNKRTGEFMIVVAVRIPNPRPTPQTFEVEFDNGHIGQIAPHK